MFGIGQSESDAIEMLKKDHREAETLFDEYEAKKEKSKPADKRLVGRSAAAAIARPEPDG